MIILASSSKSRAKLLEQARITFRQIPFKYNENFDKNLQASLYVQKTVLEKQRQFCAAYDQFKDHSLLFADSIVCIDGRIFTKARSKEQAYEMLSLQDGYYASILSAFLLQSPIKTIFSLSTTTLYFKQFKQDDLRNYVESELYKCKAGAIMCEGFHKDYIREQRGKLSTALGLDIENLKAYL